MLYEGNKPLYHFWEEQVSPFLLISPLYRMADNNFGLYPKRNSKKSLVSQLMQRPKKDTKPNRPSRTSRLTEPGMIHQADLLFLPNDKCHKYALVVVDIGSKLVDAQPLKSKEAAHRLRNDLHPWYPEDA